MRNDDCCRPNQPCPKSSHSNNARFGIWSSLVYDMTMNVTIFIRLILCSACLRTVDSMINVLIQNVFLHKSSLNAQLYPNISLFSANLQFRDVINSMEYNA